jgi:hypothetical protein
MIIDCHGHFTTVPDAHKRSRQQQLAGESQEPAEIADDEIRAAIEQNQQRVMRERGSDLTIFSPQASAMEHHVPDPEIAAAWARACNDLIFRVTELFPASFAGVCQLPQTPDGNLGACVADLVVGDLGRLRALARELLLPVALVRIRHGGEVTVAVDDHSYRRPLRSRSSRMLETSRLSSPAA